MSSGRRSVGPVVRGQTAGRCSVAGALAFVLGLALSGCAFRPPDPDPGNVILHRLEADPVFKRLPPQSRLSGPIVDQPAFYQNEGIGGGSAWQGPTVIENFSTKLSSSSLLVSVSAMAVGAGWAKYSTMYWTKHVNGTIIYLSLDPLAASGPNAYSLAASA